jgi:photosystem I P700 chlorophyll a apoprotein A2
MSSLQSSFSLLQKRSLSRLLGGVLPLLLIGCNKPMANSTTPVPQSSVEVSQMPTSQVEQGTSANSTEATQPQSSIPIQSSSPVDAKSSMEIQKAPQSTPLTVQKILSDLNAKQTDRGTVISLPGDVLFDFDKATIRPDAEATLAKINQLLSYYQNTPILIEGHTDSKGSDSYNQRLSEARSQSVRDYMVNRFKVVATRIQAKGLGETRPVAPNTNSNGSDNPAGRQRNRRVEIILQK